MPKNLIASFQMIKIYVHVHVDTFNIQRCTILHTFYNPTGIFNWNGFTVYKHGSCDTL